jgi:hypothetical protein
MTPADLLARVVARLAGVTVGHIGDRTFAPGERDRVAKALRLHQDTLARLAFLSPPFTLDHLAGAATDFGATVLAIDYLQRFGHGKELRESLDGVMSDVRRLALGGAAVVAVSSVSRQNDHRGRITYEGLGMASFRGSAELEFGADSAYVLDAADGVATLRCVKHRFGRPADVHLRFAGEYQRFDPGEPLDSYDAAPGEGGAAVTTEPPPPGSAWARLCPDAYPAEWVHALGLTTLPAGFARFASPEEMAVITGIASPGRPNDPPAKRPGGPVAARRGVPRGADQGRFPVLNAFVDEAMADLSRAAITTWLALSRDTKSGGSGRTGQTDIARRAGTSTRTVHNALRELVKAGLVEVMKRGRPGAGPSEYRIRGRRP